MNNLSIAALVQFLEIAEKKGRLPRATAAAMRSASSRVFAALEPHERDDVTRVELDDAVRRFANLNPEVGSGSLRSYRSRIDSAIKHFKDFRQDPTAWNPRRRSRKEPVGGSAGAGQDPQKQPKIRHVTRLAAASTSGSPPTPSALTYPFPLRDGITVTIMNLPRDLKGVEAERLGAFLRSLAEDFKP